MSQVFVAMLALVAIAGVASADVESRLTATVDGETRTVEVLVADDGTVTVLVDGQPVQPGAPDLPAPSALP